MWKASLFSEFQILCYHILMIWCVPILGSWPCSSPKKKDLQSGEWSSFGPKIAGFGTELGWHMEPREDTDSRGGIWKMRKWGQWDTQTTFSSLCFLQCVDVLNIQAVLWVARMPLRGTGLGRSACTTARLTSVEVPSSATGGY